MLSLRSLFALGLLFTTLLSNADAVVTYKSRMLRNKVLPRVQRKLQANITDVYVELCAPALGDTEAALVIVGGLTNLEQYRGFVYISPNNNQWWDKTCGIHGHGACSATGQIGYIVVGEEGTGIFEPVEYAWNDGDENATYMAFCIVQVDVAPRMPEPGGGPFPNAFLNSVNAICTQVTRSPNGNSCLLDLPSSSPTPSTQAAVVISPVASPMDEGESEGGADGVTATASTIPQSSGGAVPRSSSTASTDDSDSGNVQGNGATNVASASTYALFATGVVATLVTLALLNRE